MPTPTQDVVSYDKTGGSDVLHVARAPIPEPGPGEVRIAVAAASANLIDVKLRSGTMPMRQHFPVIPGIDASGIVEAVGEGVELTVGDAVFGTGRATFAEHALLTAACLKPATVDHLSATAVATIGETAFRGLAHTGVVSGGTVLIHGAAGGVGAIAVQLALRDGIHVIGTVAEKDFDFVRELGATPIAYGAGWVDRVRVAAPQGIDGVFDTAGADVLADSVALTGTADTVVTIADPRATQHGVRFTGGNAQDRRFDSYPLLADLLASGQLVVRIGHTYTLGQVVTMHDDLEHARYPGKLILIPSTGVDQE